MKIERDLVGKRVRVRNYMGSDLEFVTGMWFDGENGRYLSDPAREYVDERYQEALDTMEESQAGYYLVVELADGSERIGSCCIFPDGDKKVYDIGYCICRKHWRRGYGSEVVSLLLDWLRARGAEKVTAEVAVENLPSGAMLRRLGFEVERRAEFKKYNMDVRFDSCIYAKVL